MPSGWPKGKPRGPLQQPALGRQRKALALGRLRQRQREVNLASGYAIAGESFQTDKPGSGIAISPAAWVSSRRFVDDFAYVPNGCDEHLLHDLDTRVVYADRLGYHEPPLQDLTIDLLAAIEKQYRKNGKRAARGIPRALRPERPPITTIKKVGPFPQKITPALEARADAYEKEFRAVGKARAAALPLKREGPPLTAVVSEMFSERRGKPLSEVVSDLFDP